MAIDVSSLSSNERSALKLSIGVLLGRPTGNLIIFKAEHLGIIRSISE
jgi:hypothetical protein